MKRADVISGVVLDASVATTWGLKDESSSRGLEFLTLVSEHYAYVPPIFFTEVTNALLAAERRGRISRTDVNGTLHDLTRLKLRVTPPSLELAARHLRSHAPTI